ncbi:MAG: sulfurtransferase [Magnetococcales bacterium]|nr:sulfurtransferase [Magnetococcales bacterium]
MGAIQEIDVAKLPKWKLVEPGSYLTARQVYEKIMTARAGKNAPVVFLDVRIPAELNFLGTPTLVDANIPVERMGDQFDPNENAYNMVPNLDFVDEVEAFLTSRGLGRDTTLILMCRSGGRSAKGVNRLFKAGYKNVHTLVNGYEGDALQSGPNKGQRLINGWKNSGLPWTYKLGKELIHMP